METDRTFRRRRSTVLLVLIIALLNLPAIAVATHVFTDVQDGSTHAAGIEYVAETGITAGCTPTEYCPNDALTRAQMGTFLHRASGTSASTPPSVNAATVTSDAVQTVTSTRFVFNSDANFARVTCPEGTVVVGGGGSTSTGGWVLEASAPIGEDGWEVQYDSRVGAESQTTTVHARCLSVGP